MDKETTHKSSLRTKADRAKQFRSKNLIAVLENPNNMKNIWAIIRNINALGVEKLYIIDSKGIIPKNWEDMREKRTLVYTSVWAVKRSFVKTFKTTQECIDHLKENRFVSVVTSPHVKWKKNILLDEWNYTQIRLAVRFGNESHGISDLAVEASEACINIEMWWITESFNLAVSTGIVLYEVTKQRRKYQKENKRWWKSSQDFLK